MWTRGQLEAAGVQPILVRISAEGATGTLTVQGPDDVLAVRFRGGEIVGTDALRESFAEGLGRILVDQGLLDATQVAEVAAADLQGSISDHLLAAGLVGADDLSECVRDHCYRLLCGLLEWRSGDYQFYEGEVSWNRAVRPLSVEELLVRAADANPALTGGAIAALDATTLRPTLQNRTVHVFNWDEGAGDPGAESGDSLWITPVEDAVLKSLDGLAATAELVEVTGVDEYRLRFALHRLAEHGLTEPVVAEPAVSPTPDAAPFEAPAAAEPVPRPPPSPEPATAVAAEARASMSRLVELRSLLADLSQGFSYVLAAGLALLLLGAVVLGGGGPAALHPLPWQAAGRTLHADAAAVGAYRSLAGRLGTHHVLYGSFPNELPVPESILLAELPAGLDADQLTYEPVEDGFGVELRHLGGDEGRRFRFVIDGDFLLDPEFTRPPSESDEDPVVLVD